MRVIIVKDTEEMGKKARSHALDNWLDEVVIDQTLAFLS